MDDNIDRDDRVFVGVDLGTSRTAIAASNGVRASTPSLVGYPKDVVARKLLGREVLFGDEVIEHRLSLDVYRPLEEGVIKDTDGDRRAARDLVCHAISLARPRPDQLVYAVLGCPAQASINNKKAMIDAAREVVDSVMVASEPFAVAYGLDQLTDTLVIDIGAGTTDLCRMHGTMPAAEDQITLGIAGDAIDRHLADLLREAHPDVDFSSNMVTAAKENFADVGQNGHPVLVTWPVNGKPTQTDISAQMKSACMSLVPPIVDALQQLVASFDPEFQANLRSNVLLGGGGSQIRNLGPAIADYMDEHLGGGHVTTVEEPVYAGANGALKIALDMPDEYWERLA